MFRFKIVTTYVLVFALTLTIVASLFQSQLEPALKSDAETALRRAAVIAEKTARLDEFSLLEKAEFVAGQDGLVESFLKPYEGDEEYERHMEVHRHLETAHIFMTEFMGRGIDDGRNIDYDLLLRQPRHHEMFMALDASGVGVAAVGRGLLSWFGEDISENYPVIKEVLATKAARTDIWSWAWSGSDERLLYRVALVPIINSIDGQVLGIVVLGNTITDGIAQTKQNLLAGWDAASSTRAMTSALPPEIAIFYGQNIFGSTLSSRDQQELASNLLKRPEALSKIGPNTVLPLLLNERSYIATVRFMPGRGADETRPRAGYIILIDADLAQRSLAFVRSELLFVGVGFLLLGALLLLLFLYQFIKPLEEIEQGLQEILAGKKDYEFIRTSSSHPYAQSIAHHLNLVVAYLQGKQLPDEDIEGPGWDDMMPPSGDSSMANEKTQGGAPKVQGFMMPGAAVPPPNDEQEDESDSSQST